MRRFHKKVVASEIHDITDILSLIIILAFPTNQYSKLQLKTMHDSNFQQIKQYCER